MREVLIFICNWAHRFLVETYGKAALSMITYRKEFFKFKNSEFVFQDKERRERLKVYEDEDLDYWWKICRKRKKNLQLH